MTFDPTKPVQTRDGRKARIICTDMKNYFSIVAVAERSSGQYESGPEETITCNKDGRAHTAHAKSDDDLINIPEKRWAILFKDGSWTKCSDGGCAAIIDEQSDKITACLEFTEGEGLD